MRRIDEIKPATSRMDSKMRQVSEIFQYQLVKKHRKSSKLNLHSVKLLTSSCKIGCNVLDNLKIEFKNTKIPIVIQPLFKGKQKQQLFNRIFNY